MDDQSEQQLPSQETTGTGQTESEKPQDGSETVKLEPDPENPNVRTGSIRIWVDSNSVVHFKREDALQMEDAYRDSRTK